MKNKVSILLATVAMLATACSTGVKREPGRIYMPDMAYSRAYETYADHSNLKEKGVNYQTEPVAGTVSRSESILTHIEKDKGSDTSHYFASRALVNPITSLTAEEKEETKRQYLISCGICHGEKMDGNGPLWKGGDGPFPAKPATLVGDAKYDAMTAGTMYYSVTYGRNLMGSYASQLTPEQRWKIIYLIKSEQAAKNGTAVAAAPAATATDTTAKAN